MDKRPQIKLRPRQRGRSGVRALRRARVRTLTAPLAAALACVMVLGWPVASGADSGKGRPIVVTGDVREARGTSAELDGTVDPHGLPTTYYFLYGPSEAYGFQTPPETLEAKETPEKVGQVVANFPAGDHYRLVASNAAGAREGHDKRYGIVPTLRFDLPKTLAQLPYGAAMTLDASVQGTGNANVTVTLQESPYPYLEAFEDVAAPTVTGPNGEFSFRVPDLRSSGKFRVVAKEPRPIYSSILTQQVTPSVVLKVHKTSVPGLDRLYGTISPAETGARVLLQLNAPARPGNSERTSERTSHFATQFSTIARRGTKHMSRFSVVVKVTRAGTYRAWVDLHRGPLVAAGSSSVTLVAAAGKRRR